MEIRKTQLRPNRCYHIFNRGINGAAVFFEPKNYDFFLKQYSHYVHPFVETFTYCLLGNHFHLLIRVRSEAEIEKVIKKDKDMPHYWHVSNSFASFLQSYTRAMNKVYHRTGPLFENPFKRIEVKDEVYFTRLVAYIHRNPEKHGIIDDFREYPYSSYQAHKQEGATRLQRKELLSWFGGKNDYVAFHEQQLKAGLDAEWLLED